MNNFWYPGCASSQLLDNKPFSTQVLTHKIVLFRDALGKANALKDRCCHRGFPLSQGKVTEGIISCGFHGWEFNGTGQCVRIPSQTKDTQVPKSYCVPSFHCDEKDGYIWIWMGQESEKTECPTIPEFSQGKWMQGSRMMPCHFLRALEITFDSAHVYFAHETHPATIAAKKFGFAHTPQEIRITKNGCVAFSPPADKEGDPIPSNAFRMEFSFPGQIRFEMPMMGSSAYMIFFTTPLNHNSCRLDWLIANTNFVETSERVLWTGEGQGVIDEDFTILELTQKTYEEEGEGFEKSVESDIPTLMLRKIVKLMESGEWNPDSLPIPQRKIINMIGPAGF